MSIDHHIHGLRSRRLKHVFLISLLTVGVWTCFNMAGAAFLGSGLYFLQQQVRNRRTLLLVACDLTGLFERRVSTSSSPLRSRWVCWRLGESYLDSARVMTSDDQLNAFAPPSS